MVVLLVLLLVAVLMLGAANCENAGNSRDSRHSWDLVPIEPFTMSEQVDDGPALR